MSDKPIWTPSTNLIAQIAHFEAGMLGTILWPGWGAAIMFCWALLKEFIWDTLIEDATFESNLTDFAFYCVGIVAGGLWLIFQ